MVAVKISSRGLAEEDVGLSVRWIVARIIPAQVHRAADRVHREPLIELIFTHTGWIVIDTHRRTPRRAAIP